MASVSRGSIEDLVRRLERMPTTIQREALRPAARVARVAGYTAAAKKLADDTGTRPEKWKISHRVFTSVEPGGVEARSWIGTAPYLVRRRGRGNVFAEFPAGYDPGPAVADVMQGAYLRVAEAKLREIIGDS